MPYQSPEQLKDVKLREKSWRHSMKMWQRFILFVQGSKGRIVKKQLDKYRLELKSYRADLAQFAKREKFLRRAQLRAKN